MAYIDEIAPQNAGAELAEVYAGISARGSVANILRVQSLHPAGLRTHYALYRTIMFGPSPLTRAEREAMAVEVSRANECHY